MSDEIEELMASDLSQSKLSIYGFNWTETTEFSYKYCNTISVTPYSFLKPTNKGKTPYREFRKNRYYVVEENGRETLNLNEKAVFSHLKKAESKYTIYNEEFSKLDFSFLSTFKGVTLDKSFKNFTQARDFFTAEEEFWESLTDEESPDLSFISEQQSFYTGISSQFNAAYNCILADNVNSFISTCEKIKQILVNPSQIVLYKDHEFTIFIISQMKTSIEKGIAAYNFLINANLPPFNERNNNTQNLTQYVFDLSHRITDEEYFSGLVETYIFLNQDSLGKVKQLYTEINSERSNELSKNIELLNSFQLNKNKEFNGLKNEHEDLLESSNTNFATFMAKAETEYEGKIKKLEEEYKDKSEKLDTDIVELENTYREHLRLKEPANYWEEQRERYQNSGLIWLSLSLVISVLLIIFFSWVSINIQSLGTKNWNPAAVKSSLLIISAATAGFYLLNLFIKLALSSYHLSKDAAERLQLSHFYLSLITKGAINEDERSIVLQALFSRSDTGLFKKDSGPTMPIDISQISKFNKSIS